MNARIRTASLLVGTLFCIFSFLPSQEKKLSLEQGVPKTNTGLPYVLMNANNLTSWVHSDGFYNWLVKQSWNGEFPKGSGVGTVFSEGIVFGGKVHDGLYADSIRVTGDTYQIGMQPGAILSDASGNTTGTDNPNDLSVRAFAVRPDMPASLQNDTASWPDLRMDAATFFQKNKDSVTSQDIRQIANQYFTDWLGWPAGKGAPWFDDKQRVVRNDAGYDPTNPHDIPGIPDAAKTIWYVCNDLNAPVTASFAGSPPTGIEEQVTTWAYNLSGVYEPLNNVIYKQVKLIYKGNHGAPINSRIDSLYVCQWVDGDIGDGGDDFIGCDSMLSLAYEYNSKTLDSKYEVVGLTAPADGYAFLQGASYSTGNPLDSAVINFRWRHGYKYWYNPAMTVFIPHWSGGTISDPDIGPYSGTLQWYNFMRGYLPRPSYPGGVPFWKAFSMYDNNLVTNYFLCGDPLTSVGWIDGIAGQPGDRRFWASHGPITVGLHDTAELVFAHVAAIGGDNRWSVQVLKYYTTFAKFLYGSIINPSSIATSVQVLGIPRSFEVSQNYPNPFNPTTTIRYQIPVAGRVSIQIYNLLGQNIAIIVNGLRNAGAYSAEWNATNVPSGVYFYRTEVTPLSAKASSFRDVKKMLLFK